MSEIEVTMTELRQQLGSIINRAAYGRDVVVLVSHGKPKAAIIGVEELQQLRALHISASQDEDPYRRFLAAADSLREQDRIWQEKHSIEPEDSVDTLRRLREDLS